MWKILYPKQPLSKIKKTGRNYHHNGNTTTSVQGHNLCSDRTEKVTIEKPQRQKHGDNILLYWQQQ